MAVHGAPGVPPVTVPVIEEVEDEGCVEVTFPVFKYQSGKGVSPEYEGPPFIRPASVPGVVMVRQHRPGHGVSSGGAPLEPVGRLERIFGVAPVAPLKSQTCEKFHLRVSVFRFHQDFSERELFRPFVIRGSCRNGNDGSALRRKGGGCLSRKGKGPRGQDGKGGKQNQGRTAEIAL